MGCPREPLGEEVAMRDCLCCSNCEVLTTLTPDTGRILSKLHTVQPKGKITFCTGIRVAHVSGLAAPLQSFLLPNSPPRPWQGRGEPWSLLLLQPNDAEPTLGVLPQFPCLQTTAKALVEAQLTACSQLAPRAVPWRAQWREALERLLLVPRGVPPGVQLEFSGRAGSVLGTRQVPLP